MTMRSVELTDPSLFSEVRHELDQTSEMIGRRIRPWPEVLFRRKQTRRLELIRLRSCEGSFLQVGNPVFPCRVCCCVKVGIHRSLLQILQPSFSLCPSGKSGEPVCSPGHSGSQTTSPVALPPLRTSNHNPLTVGTLCPALAAVVFQCVFTAADGRRAAVRLEIKPCSDVLVHF